MKNQELHIANVNKAWEGYFTCRANNSYGKSEALAYVTVKGTINHVLNIPQAQRERERERERERANEDYQYKVIKKSLHISTEK